MGWVAAEKRVVAARRVCDILRSRIVYSEGQHRLASEDELTREFQVSRNVVRAALGMLQEEGLISRLRGTGSFPQPHSGSFQLDRFDALAEQFCQVGPMIPHLVLVAELISAPPAVASALEIGAGEEVVLVEKVATHAAEPIALLTSYFPADLAAGVLDQDLSMLTPSFLPQVISPLVVTSNEARFSAIPCDEPTAEILGVRAGIPMMLHENTKRVNTGRIVDLTFRRTRGDRYALTWSGETPD